MGFIVTVGARERYRVDQHRRGTSIDQLRPVVGRDRLLEPPLDHGDETGEYLVDAGERIKLQKPCGQGASRERLAGLRIAVSEHH